ncbi:MAG: extracellular solute-binding protein [Pseudomonadota bacterium]
MSLRSSFLVAVGALFVLSACGNSQPADDPSASDASSGPQSVTLYSTRHYDADQLIFDAFEAQTGIEVQAREAGAAQLLETMRAEGDASPADVILAADAGSLWRFKDAGLTQAVASETLETAIPARLQDAENHWFGLAKRYRIIAYDPERLSAEQVSSMTNLTAAEMEGEICVRSSSNVYNLSLMGELIDRLGSVGAQQWADSVVGNMARDPSGGDTDQIRAIAAGACSAAIVNHYYWVRLSQSESEADLDVAASTMLSFADAGNGTHTNVTAAGVAANAPNPEGAVAFIEFLASPEGQALLVSDTKEFPVVAGVPLPAGLDGLPEIIESDLDLSTLGNNQVEAQQIFDRAGWP